MSETLVIKILPETPSGKLDVEDALQQVQQTDGRPQIETFREVARQLGADDAAEDRFNAALEKVGKAPPRRSERLKDHKPPSRRDKTP